MFDALLQELAQNGSVRFYIRVRPNASKTVALSIMNDQSIKVDVAAPPEGGKANRELVQYLAKEFSVPKTHVQIVSGQTARHKLVKIESQGSMQSKE